MAKKNKSLIFIPILLLIILVVIINYNKIMYMYKSSDYELCDISDIKLLKDYERIADKAIINAEEKKSKYKIYNREKDYKLNLQSENIYIELNNVEDKSMDMIINNTKKVKISNVDIYDKDVLFYPDNKKCIIIKTSNIKKSTQYIKDKYLKKDVVYLRISDDWYKVSNKK